MKSTYVSPKEEIEMRSRIITNIDDVYKIVLEAQEEIAKEHKPFIGKPKKDYYRGQWDALDYILMSLRGEWDLNFETEILLNEKK